MPGQRRQLLTVTQSLAVHKRASGICTSSLPNAHGIRAAEDHRAVGQKDYCSPGAVATELCRGSAR